MSPPYRTAPAHGKMFSFANAAMMGSGIWKLSRLVRGIGGEEFLAARTLPSGATFILLDQAVVPLVTELSQLGATHRFRIGPANSDYADNACVEISSTVGSKALRPYSPVRARARRVSSGIELSFIRRSRRDADGWETLDIPIGEEREAHEIEILNGGNVVRTLMAGASSLTYPAVDELADFGVPQASLDLRLYQFSDLVGRGYPLSGSVPVA